jgi:hypothetical protein
VGAWSAAQVVKKRALSRVVAGVDVEAGLVVVVVVGWRLGRSTLVVRVVLTRDFGGAGLVTGLVSWKNPSKLTFWIDGRGIMAVSVKGRVLVYLYSPNNREKFSSSTSTGTFSTCLCFRAAAGGSFGGDRTGPKYSSSSEQKILCGGDGS